MIVDGSAAGASIASRESAELGSARVASGAGRSFGDVLATALAGADAAVASADGQAAALAAGAGSATDASIARAKADVVLELVSVATSKLSAAINALLQTQV